MISRIDDIHYGELASVKGLNYISKEDRIFSDTSEDGKIDYFSWKARVSEKFRANEEVITALRDPNPKSKALLSVGCLEEDIDNMDWGPKGYYEKLVRKRRIPEAPTRRRATKRERDENVAPKSNPAKKRERDENVALKSNPAKKRERDENVAPDVSEAMVTKKRVRDFTGGQKNDQPMKRALLVC